MNIKVISVGVPNIDELNESDKTAFLENLLSSIRKIKTEN